MKILLINSSIRINVTDLHFPYGLGIIASVLRDAGHEVLVFDPNAKKLDVELTKKRADSFIPDVDLIGISGLITTYAFQKELIRYIKKKYPEKMIVSGGGCATVIPELMLEKTDVDYIVIGEGEHTVIELIRSINGETDIKTIDGIGYKKDGKVNITKSRVPEKNISKFPLSAYDLFDTDQYVLKKSSYLAGLTQNTRYFDIHTARGCAYDCNFCYRLFGNRYYKIIDHEKVFEEIDYLIDNYNINFIGISDEMFVKKKSDIIKFGEGMKKRGIPWSISLRVDQVNQDLIDILIKYNCVHLQFGMESGDDRILKNMNKKTTRQQGINAFDLCEKNNIHYGASFIFGYFGENIRSIINTKTLKLKYKMPVGEYWINLYPGTKGYDDAVEKGLIKDEESYILSLADASDFVINLTNHSDQKIKFMKKWSERIYMYCLFFVKPKFFAYNLLRIFNTKSNIWMNKIYPF